MTFTPEEQAFIDAFEQGTLAPDAFHHRDHVRLAWLYLRRYPVPEVLMRYGEGLQRFTKRLGKEGVYHETITYAFIFLINERMRQGARDASWETFTADHADLLIRSKAVLEAYYRTETLASPFARSVFVMPDRGVHPV